VGQAEANWRKADAMISEWVAKGEPLTMDRIFEINKTLGEGLKNNGGKVGELRDHAVNAGGFAKQYLEVGEVKPAMADFMTWYNSAKETMPPIELAAQAYQKLVSIHPFSDANGRTCRMVMDMILENHGLPPATLQGDEVNVATYFLDGFSDSGGVTPQMAVENVTRGVERSLELMKSH
jgi:Fic family protein